MINIGPNNVIYLLLSVKIRFKKEVIVFMVVKRKLIWVWEADYASYFIPRICILDINESLGNKSVNTLIITNLVHDYHNYVLPYILLFSSHIICIQLK